MRMSYLYRRGVTVMATTVGTDLDAVDDPARPPPGRRSVAPFDRPAAVLIEATGRASGGIPRPLPGPGCGRPAAPTVAQHPHLPPRPPPRAGVWAPSHPHGGPAPTPAPSAASPGRGVGAQPPPRWPSTHTSPRRPPPTRRPDAGRSAQRAQRRGTATSPARVEPAAASGTCRAPERANRHEHQAPDRASTDEATN